MTLFLNWNYFPRYVIPELMDIRPDQPENFPLINTDKVSFLLSKYKFPLLLGVSGIILLTAALIVLVGHQGQNQAVVFETQASGSAQVNIKADIAGAVIKPGVYELVRDSRVADLLTLAQGLTAEADREWMAKNLNRAAKLADGAKVYIPSVKESASGKISGALRLPGDSNTLGMVTKTVNINSASEQELDTLPGIGPVTAGKIISNRPYQSVEDLKTRKIIGAAIFEKLRSQLSL